MARHYAQHGLKDLEGYFDSADEEVQTIMNQDRDGQGASSLRDVVNVKLNVFEQSHDSESIEVLSGHESSGDEEFLGYYVVDPVGKKRPIPAPRRLVQMPMTNGDVADALNVEVQSSVPTDGDIKPKTGKAVVTAEVIRHRISLSDDSQGRYLSLIPPGYDEHSMLKLLPQQITLPQQQSTEEAWHQAVQSFDKVKHASALMVIHLMQESSCRIV